MNAQGPITVVARWQVTEGRMAEVLELVTALRQQSLTEPGCLGYDVFRGTDTPDTLLLLERYRDNAAIEEHRNALHFRQLVLERIVPMLSRRQVELLRA